MDLVDTWSTSELLSPSSDPDDHDDKNLAATGLSPSPSSSSSSSSSSSCSGDDPSGSGVKVTVVRSTVYDKVHTIAAVALWLCTLHLNLLLICTALFFFSPISLILLIGVMALMTVVPVDERSGFGQMIARYVGKHAMGYFPVTVHIEDIKAFDPNQAYVLAAEPHSIFPLGCLSLMNITGFLPLSKTKALASTAVFYTPFLRQIGTWLGLIPATRRNFVKYLQDGYSCIIVPGGVQEIIYMSHGFEVAFLKSRRGFIRVALETGTPLVPIFCFGQSKVYKWWKPDGELYVRIARALRFAPLLFWGAFGSPIPYRHPMHVVVGKPIEMKQNSAPDEEEVARVHERFITALEDLFQRYKAVAGYKDTDLRVI